jgi:RimJ/RimL family protein N-acetyltransferase
VQSFDTARLHLRPLTQDDEALYCGLYSDHDTMRYIGEPLSPDRAARSFRKVLAASSRCPLESLFLSIVEKSFQRSVGICGIAQMDATTRRAEIGILLAPMGRSRGLAGEALTALVSETFSVFPVDEIWVECSAEDPAVARLNTRVGFVLHGEERGKESLSQHIWSIQRATWKLVETIANRGEDRV